MNLDDLKEIINSNLENKNKEFKRVFHGRGNFYENFSYLTVDSIDKIFFASFYQKVNIEDKLIEFLEGIAKNHNFEAFIIQRRYINNAPSEIVFGMVNKDEVAIENGLKYQISFSNKNIGIFPDMKLGREFIKEISKDKNVLNLFSYTCAFSVCAISGKAKKVVNVDMAKSALNMGRQNHRINNLDTKKVKFLPYNILKSWSKIKKEGPYDIIIIDPPSFQRGSFAATKDYKKIIKRLDELANSESIILSCLNAPELNETFIKELFKEYAPKFIYKKRLENLNTFPSSDEQKSLKNLIFKRLRDD